MLSFSCRLLNSSQCRFYVDFCIVLLLCRYHKDINTRFSSLKAKKASSFHEFAHSTNDAWDLDDEEDEDPLKSPTASATPLELSIQTEVN